MCKQSADLGCSDGMLDFGGNNFSFFPSIGLKLTGACRLNCPFCCEPDRKQTVYDVNKFIKITKVLSELGAKRLCFTGGDPLLYPNIDQLLKHTKMLGFYNLLLTGDGTLLNKNHNKLFPYLDAVRFSIHAMESQHDKIVKQTGAFSDMEKALDILTEKKVPCFVTTVVSPLSFDSILDVAEWCIYKKIKTYFLFGLMRSGKGADFIEKVGEVPEADISKLICKLKQKYTDTQLEIIHYDYKKNAECILIYGDGKVVIDPYPTPPLFQLEIGNILFDTPAEIIHRFKQDPENHKGHYEHLKRYYKEMI